MLKNGVSVVGSGEPDTADKAPAPAKPFSFWDLVDIVNPLQHIPVVNTLYRKITGDEIGSVARVIGGGIYGGFAGAALGGVNAVLADSTGKDIGETVLAMITGDDDKPATAEPAAVQTADAATPLPITPSGHALFDAHGKSAVSKTHAPVQPPVPVIEVRPNAQNNVLPTSQNMQKLADVSLNDIDPSAPVAPKLVEKQNVQQAMMDALLKMQANQSQDPADDQNVADDKS